MPDNIKVAFITGAAGFIGSHTVQYFCSEGWFVYALIHKSDNEILQQLESSKKVKILRGDASCAKDMERCLNRCNKTPDIIVHCAGRASDVGRASEFRTANYESVKILTAQAKSRNISRLIFISTTDVYGLRDFNGESENELPYDPAPRNNYPKYKILAEKHIRKNLPAKQYSIIRPAAVWADDDPTLTRRVRQFLEKSPFIINFGRWRGKNRWPMVHVSTVARAIFVAATDPRACGLAINILDEKTTSIDEFYRFIAEKFFPHRKFKTVCLPMWLGFAIAWPVSVISNILNLKTPFYDPSVYALRSVSSNLDFSCRRLKQLLSGKGNCR